ncbi:MAG: sodium transport system permease protein [Pseudohongiellaceae bacterium]|jgi:sodium transport system permease protein
MMWSVITRKELKDALRDRRALGALLLFPILGPVMIYFMFNMIIDIAEEAGEVSLPVVGAQYANDLVDYLEQNGIEIETVNLNAAANPDSDFYSEAQLEEIREAIRSRRFDFVLLVPEKFDELIGASRSSNIELHMESTRTTASPKIGRVDGLIQAWGRETAALRLITRGVNPAVIAPVNVVRVDVASQQSRVQSILGMVPFFVIMAAFVCGMGVAVDVTAGERERKSLEPLLVNPVPRYTIVIGKWMAAVVFSAVGLVLVMILNFFSLSLVPLEEVGIVFNIGSLEIIGVLVTTLPLALFAPSIQIFVGIFAKSFKDAQAYLSFIMMLPMAPFFFNMLNTQDREFWMNFVPMLGQHMLLTDVVRGETPEIIDFLLAGLTLLFFSLLFVYGASQLMKRERIIFS